MASIRQAQFTSLNGEALTDSTPVCWAGDVLTGVVNVANGRIRTSISKVRHLPLLSDIEHLLVNLDADTIEITRAAQKNPAIFPDREFRFSVQVPDACGVERCMHFTDDSSPQQKLVLHHQMPPSTVSESESGSKDEAADLVRITYCVLITIWQDGHIKTHKILPILIKPKLQLLSFPTSEQSGGEIYVEKEWNDLGSLRVEVYCPDNCHLAWPPKAKNVPINLVVKLCFNPIHPAWGLPPMSEMSTKLIAETAFQRAEPREGKKWTKSQVLSATTFSVGTVSWVWSSQSLTGGFEYVAWVPVPLQLPLGENMLTSFKSCIAGREFAAHVGFVFGLGAGKDVDVVVPISIEPCIEVTTAH
ncbi:hypothetical protein PENARI_c013G05499 [Penicillium arizonense]|uniref:Arrestin-like N-terminal domain-containing protein n=1 Tax=Penicillium arizonense TaxID=1835702 RepID=A0A1F5LEF4_PENAI|nr:hypothetical protein PENARI_c013G05499 [Penicillium arizonense]OGE51593.1 hypothetical protein PENARI_c013G05499 [Penicillium arizonense]